MSEELSMAVVELKRDEVAEMVINRADKGENPVQILEECRKGMTIVGDRFPKGDNYVAELGVDVSPSIVLQKVKEVNPDFVGFSALITTAFESMKEAADMLTEAGLRDQLKLMVGGGVTTPLVQAYVGADFQTVDAMEGVAYCMEVMGGK